jgi:hypothetical protein
MEIGDQVILDAAIANLINGAPATLDTLDELAAAIGDDANFAATMTTALAGKQPLDSDLTQIAALTPANDDFLRRSAGVWTNQTPAAAGLVVKAGSYTAIGSNAGPVNTDTSLTAVGLNALSLNTTGTQNTGVGRSALRNTTTGGQNTAVGAFALNGNTTGSSNTALGVNALISNTTGSSNTALGAEALFSNTIGVSNAAIGDDALRANTGGSSNMAVGVEALLSNTTGAGNVGIGVAALRTNTTGNSNVAIGGDALLGNTIAHNNVAVGVSALRSNTTGENNIAIGPNTLYSPNGVAANATVSGARQVALGSEAGQGSATQRNDITVIGYRALAGGNNAIAIGSGVSAGAAGAVAIGKDSAGTSASTTTQDEIKLGTVLHTVKILGSITGPLSLLGSTNVVQSLVRGAASQTANLEEWRDSASVLLASIGSQGNLVLPAAAIRAFNHTNPANTGAYVALSGTGTDQAGIIQRVASAVAFVVRGAASQTADLQQWQDSAAVVGMAVDSARKLKWPAAFSQTTVGAAGTAAMLPAMPREYIQVVTPSGSGVIPVYAAA